MEVLFEWAQQFAKGMGYIWNWLTTTLNVEDLGIFTPILEKLGVDTIVPIYLVVGTACIVGLVRRLL